MSRSCWTAGSPARQRIGHCSRQRTRSGSRTAGRSHGVIGTSGRGGGGMRLPIADQSQLRAHTGRLLRRHRRGLALVLTLHGLAATAGLAGPWLLGRMVDAVAGGTTASVVDRVAIILVVAVLARTVLIRYAQQSAMVLGESVFAELRENFIAAVTRLPLSTVERAGTGDLAVSYTHLTLPT